MTVDCQHCGATLVGRTVGELFNALMVHGLEDHPDLPAPDGVQCGMCGASPPSGLTFGQQGDAMVSHYTYAHADALPSWLRDA